MAIKGPQFQYSNQGYLFQPEEHHAIARINDQGSIETLFPVGELSEEQHELFCRKILEDLERIDEVEYLPKRYRDFMKKYRLWLPHQEKKFEQVSLF